MSLRNLLTDRVTLIKPDGRRYENISVSVQNDIIYTDYPKLPIEENDVFERRLPHGLLERYTIFDRGYIQDPQGRHRRYESKVRRSESPGPNPISHTDVSFSTQPAFDGLADGSRFEVTSNLKPITV